jgi:hypothetical protein
MTGAWHRSRLPSQEKCDRVNDPHGKAVLDLSRREFANDIFQATDRRHELSYHVHDQHEPLLNA